MKKLLISGCLALAVASVSLHAETITMQGTAFNVTRVTDKQLAPGVQYLHLEFPGHKTSAGATGHVFLTIADLTRSDLAVEYYTASGTVGGSTKSLASIASAHSTTGHQVLAGANANFWITSEKPWASQLKTMPFGTSISCGQLNTPPNNKNLAHCGGPARTGAICYGTDRRMHISAFTPVFETYLARLNYTMDLDDANRVVRAGSASIYNKQYGTAKAFKPVDVSADGTTLNIVSGISTEVLLDLKAGESWHVGGDTKFIIKEIRQNAGTGTLGSHDLAIVGRDSYATVMNQNYQVGDEIVLRQRFPFADGTTPEVLSGTSGNVMAMTGGVLNTAEVKGETYNTNYYGRTLYGTNADGSKLYIAVCGNKSGVYYGFTVLQMADLLKHFGATNAAQVDGGGSAQMYADGAQVNQSTDSGGLRAVHSGMFIVSTAGAAQPASLSVNPAAINFNCKQNEHPSATVTVTASGLTDKIAIGSITPGRFTPSVSELPATGGTFTVTFNISDKVGTYGTGGTAVDYNFFVRVKSGSTEQVIPITATVTSNDDTPDEPDPVVPTEFDGNFSASDVKTIWSYDSTNAPSWVAFDNTQSTNRSIAWSDDKLYVLLSKSSVTPEIVVLDAETGQKTGNVNVTGYDNSTIALGALTTTDDGKLVACNVAVSNTDKLRVYYWNDDASAPVKLISVDAFGQQTGGSIAFSGTLANGRVWLTRQGGAAVMYFNVTNGTCDGVAHVIDLKNAAGDAYTYTDDGRGASQVYPCSDGTFWVAIRNSVPTHFNADGTYIEAMKLSALGGNTYGTSFAPVTFGRQQYVVASTYKHATNLYQGQMALVKTTDGIAAATAPMVVLPANGLADATSTHLNNQRCTTVLARTRTEGSNAYLDMWHNSLAQGLAHYQAKVVTSGIENVIETADNNVPCRYYNLQGIEVNADNLTPGLYIRRQGRNTAKVLVR